MVTLMSPVFLQKKETVEEDQQPWWSSLISFQDMELIVPQLERGKYTWFKGDGNNAASRIDRFLFSKEWDDNFTKINHTPLHRLVSDHNPVALQCGEWEKNKSYLKFDNWWLNTWFCG